MALADFRFRTDWLVPAGPDAVYEVLRDVEHYPRWWPQVRTVRQIDERTARLRIRSRLPVDLVCTAERVIEDSHRRLLLAVLVGDLTGWSQWAVVAAGTTGSGSVATFTEEVRVAGLLMRAASVLARPILTANHSAMMAAGQRGIVEHFAA